ncbi:uncharacterized [Tachysurus ichikawai]
MISLVVRDALRWSESLAESDPSKEMLSVGCTLNGTLLQYIIVAEFSFLPQRQCCYSSQPHRRRHSVFLLYNGYQYATWFCYGCCSAKNIAPPPCLAEIITPSHCFMVYLGPPSGLMVNIDPPLALP